MYGIMLLLWLSRQLEPERRAGGMRPVSLPFRLSCSHRLCSSAMIDYSLRQLTALLDSLISKAKAPLLPAWYPLTNPLTMLGA